MNTLGYEQFNIEHDRGPFMTASIKWREAVGLDMYLKGEKQFEMHLVGEKNVWGDFEHPEKNRKEDGHEVRKIEVELGYWRKHPNLHGYIVTTFADNIDDCQRVELGSEDLNKIMEAVKDQKLPHTTGFFFGESRLSPEEIKNDLDILNSALKWLQTNEKGVYRSVYYQASW